MYLNNTLSAVAQAFNRLLAENPYLSNHCLQAIEIMDKGHQLAIALRNPQNKRECTVVRVPIEGVLNEQSNYHG